MASSLGRTRAAGRVKPTRACRIKAANRDAQARVRGKVWALGPRGARTNRVGSQVVAAIPVSNPAQDGPGSKFR